MGGAELFNQFHDTEEVSQYALRERQGLSSTISLKNSTFQFIICYHI